MVRITNHCEFTNGAAYSQIRFHFALNPDLSGRYPYHNNQHQ